MSEISVQAIAVFVLLVGGVLALSFYLGKKARSAQGYFAAHGQVHWFINGIAFAGDYLSAASFLGICGLIAFYGYDGFLYSIGFLAGWVVALFVIAEPIKRLGKFTFADALDSRFNSRAIKLAAAISTLVVSLFYLIPQMVGAGTLIHPLLGLPVTAGVVTVGGIVILIVVTAGMVSTTWVQFIKGSLLILVCLVLTILILRRGLSTDPKAWNPAFRLPERIGLVTDDYLAAHHLKRVPATGPWEKSIYLRLADESGHIRIFRRQMTAGWTRIDTPAVEVQYRMSEKGKPDVINGVPATTVEKGEFFPVGSVVTIPTAEAGSKRRTSTGPLGPVDYLAAVGGSTVLTWRQDPATISETVDGGKRTTTIWYPVLTTGSELLTPGNHPYLFKGVRTQDPRDQWNFVSLMLALFCGTAALPHILIRYYTVRDQAAARRSTVVGIISIGSFYVLTLFLGLGAMTSGVLDPSDINLAAPYLARSFGTFAFALISAIAFTTVLGTVSGLIMAASGAVAHDLVSNVFRMNLGDHAKVRLGKFAAVGVGIVGILLGILFQGMNVAFLVGWAFNVAASANLPAIIMLLFWRRTTRQGIAASILVGLGSSLVWILLSSDAYVSLYGLAAKDAIAPFNQPAVVTVPLSFLTLVIVSLLTPAEAGRREADA